MVRRLLRGVWEVGRPPHGCDVRRYVAFSLLGFGLIRMLHLTAAGQVALSWLPGEAYGGIKVGLGLALLLTNGRRRLSWCGYAVAWLTLAFCAMAAADSWPITNGMWIYMLLGWAMLGEAASRHECV